MEKRTRHRGRKGKEIENEEKKEGGRQMQRGRKGEEQHCCSLEEK